MNNIKRLDIQKIDISSLKPAKYNPRKDLQKDDIEYKKIENSINKFGYVDPIIVNKDMTIIGGHQRYTVLKDMGIKEIDCVVKDVNKRDEKALNIALNKISGSWNDEKLKVIFDELKSENFDLNFTGFNTEEIEDMFSTDMSIIDSGNHEVNEGGHLHKSSISSIIFNIHTYRLKYNEDDEIVKRFRIIVEKLNDETIDNTRSNEIITCKMLELLEELEYLE